MRGGRLDLQGEHFQRGFGTRGLRIVETGTNGTPCGDYVERVTYGERDRPTQILHQSGCGGSLTTTTFTRNENADLVEKRVQPAGGAAWIERYTYAGTVVSGYAYLDGRAGWSAVRDAQLRLVSTRWFDGADVRVYTFTTDEHGDITRVHLSRQGFEAREADSLYTWDEHHHMLSRTDQPPANPEGTARTEYDWSADGVVAIRQLGVSGVLHASQRFDRTPGAVTLVADDNGDGEPDRTLDMRDECPSGGDLSDFAELRPDPTVEGVPPVMFNLE